MERSKEVESILRAWYENCSDVKAVEGLLSNSSDLLLVGSDPGEWMEGFAAIHAHHELQGSSQFRIEVDEMFAYREGSVAWVADRTRYILPDGRTLPLRHTLVLHQESGAWKIVHMHYSIGVPNSEIKFIPAAPN